MVELTVVVCYLVAMVAISWVVRPKTATKEDYFIAGRKLPYWVVAFSMNATGESAWLLLGLSGVAYVVGISAFWIVIGETLGIWFSWTLLARRLKDTSAEVSAVTLPDVLAARLGDPLKLVRIVSVTIILTMVLVYVAAQMLATGKAFESFLGWNYTLGVLAGGAVTVAYTSFGGFRGVAYTDAAQAGLMVFAVVAVPIAGLLAVGGMGPLVDALSTASASHLSPIDFSQGTTLGLVALASALAVGLPFLGVPQLLVRYMTLSGDADVPKAKRVSVFVIFLLGSGAVATGLVGRALFPGLDDAETIMPVLSEELFPPVITGLLIAAVLSAVMSTVSSLMTLASSAVVGDVYHKIFRPGMDTGKLGRPGLVVTVVIGTIGTALALNQDSTIFDLVLFAWAGLGAAFGPPIIAMLWWRRTTWQGATAGIIGGFATTVLWLLFFKERLGDFYEVIPGMIAGFACVVVVSLLTGGPRKAGNIAP